MTSGKESASKEETSINIRDGVNHKASSSNGEVTLTPENEKASNQHLTEQEQRILDRQIDTPLVKISYFTLYRYATKVDLIIIAISSICAIAAGSVFPLMTASIPNHFLFEFRLLIEACRLSLAKSLVNSHPSYLATARCLHSVMKSAI